MELTLNLSSIKRPGSVKNLLNVSNQYGRYQMTRCSFSDSKRQLAGGTINFGVVHVLEISNHSIILLKVSNSFKVLVETDPSECFVQCFR